MANLSLTHVAAKTALRPLKEFSRSVLTIFRLYERARASFVRDLYLRLADPRSVEDRRREVDFYQRLLVGLPKGGLIFDIGANHGDKTDVFLRLGARVVAIEPDRACQGVLAQRFLRYRLKRKPVVIVGRAVSDRSGVETMWAEEPGSALNTLSTKWAESLRKNERGLGQKFVFAHSLQVETVSMDQLVATYGSPFFVKIDVEGYELNVLRGLHQPVPFLSFEVNLPDFRQEGLGCVSLLQGLSGSGRFNYTSSCRKGLALDHWLRAPEFLSVLRECSAPSIEVFWGTTVA